MRPEDFHVVDPDPSELWKAIEALPAVAPERLDQLEADLRATADLRLLSVTHDLLDEARAQVDSRNAPPPTSHRKYLGPPIVFTKRAFRVLARPVISELLRRQVDFNAAIVAAGERIVERLYDQRREQREWQLGIEARLRKLEGDPGVAALTDSLSAGPAKKKRQ